MIVRFIKNYSISDGFTPNHYKEGEVADLSDLALSFVLKNGIAVSASEPSEQKVVTPSKTKVTRPSKAK